MAVYQATNKPAVSLPNGASSLPLEVLPLLERFDKIYLWMDHDGAGQAGVDKFVQKLVRNSASSRCFNQACIDSIAPYFMFLAEKISRFRSNGDSASGCHN